MLFELTEVERLLPAHEGRLSRIRDAPGVRGLTRQFQRDRLANGLRTLTLTGANRFGFPTSCAISMRGCLRLQDAELRRARSERIRIEGFCVARPSEKLRTLRHALTDAVGAVMLTGRIFV